MSPKNHPTRVLALDVGNRRIGLAVTDPLGITAQGLATLQRKNKRADFEQLRRILEEFQIGEIVLGDPKHMSGDLGAQSAKAAELADELRRRFQLPVHLWDERLTSAQANRLLREAQLSSRRRAHAVDRMAASLILQSFLEHRAAQKTAEQKSSKLEP